MSDQNCLAFRGVYIFIFFDKKYTHLSSLSQGQQRILYVNM